MSQVTLVTRSSVNLELLQPAVNLLSFNTRKLTWPCQNYNATFSDKMVVKSTLPTDILLLTPEVKGQFRIYNMVPKARVELARAFQPNGF